VSRAWDGSAPPELPAYGLPGWMRLAVRGPLAVLWTLTMFGLFLLLRAVDRLLPGAGLAPWIVLAWARVALRLVGLRVRREGRAMHLPGAVVANHSSWLDIVTLQSCLRLFFVSKAEVRDWPGIGLVGRAIGTMFVERRPAEAQRQHAELHARLSRGDRMCIFAEGTSTDGRRVLPFKTSLFAVFVSPDLREKLWVQPVSLAYRAPAGLPSELYAWWGDMDFAAHLKDLLALSAGGEVVARFHAPLRVAEFPHRKALAEAAERAVRAGFEEARAAVPGAAALDVRGSH
jgi:lyso-ornithine lipid O-acyltransferase